MLEVAERSVRAHVVAQGRAAGFDRLVQHLVDRGHQPLGMIGRRVLLVRERRGLPLRRQMRAKQRLADIDVAQAGNDTLIQQRRLQTRGLARRRLGQHRRVESVAERLRPAAEKIADAVGDGRGRLALDVAAGTGSVAVALAGRGWRVGAVDIAPALIAHGRERTQGLGIDWYEAPLDALPFPDSSFDLMASSFGLIFAPDPHAALTELRRCLRPGGQLAFTAWTPGGYMGQMTAVMMGFMPPGPLAAETGPFVG